MWRPVPANAGVGSPDTGDHKGRPYEAFALRGDRATKDLSYTLEDRSPVGSLLLVYPQPFPVVARLRPWSATMGFSLDEGVSALDLPEPDYSAVDVPGRDDP